MNDGAKSATRVSQMRAHNLGMMLKQPTLKTLFNSMENIMKTKQDSDIENKKMMDFLKRQAQSSDSSTFQAGRFYGSCEVLCMAGIITAEQWQELDDIRGCSTKKKEAHHE